MKHDIVYLVKESPTNEELRYSLRSVCENFSFRNVVFYGGRPSYLKPDRWVHVVQNQRTKWMRTTNMVRLVCMDPEVSDDWWLFNDDFFVMQKTPGPPPTYEGNLFRHIVGIESRHGQTSTAYTRELRKTAETLEKAGLTTLNYALHMPILINKEKALATLEAFPNAPMFRSLYGNMNCIGTKGKDIKIMGLERLPGDEDVFISTTDDSFASGAVGRLIRERFPDPCKYEL